MFNVNKTENCDIKINVHSDYRSRETISEFNRANVVLLDCESFRIHARLIIIVSSKMDFTSEIYIVHLFSLETNI